MIARSIVSIGCLALSLAVPAVPTLAKEGGPFASLSGRWSGSGHVRFEGGQTERISCRANYTPSSGGSGLGLTLRCASASNKIELYSSMSASNGRVTGQWEERSFGVSGTVSGRADGGNLTLRINGDLAGSMRVSTSGASQSVSISTSGASLQGVHVALSR